LKTVFPFVFVLYFDLIAEKLYKPSGLRIGTTD